MNLRLESADSKERTRTGNRLTLRLLALSVLGLFLALAMSTAATVHGQLFDSPLVGSCTNVSLPEVTGGKLGNLPDNAGPENTCNRNHCVATPVSLIHEL